MPGQNEIVSFFLKRRSRSYKTLRAPIPDREELSLMLTAAARSPDHGKLEPWRFLVLYPSVLERLAEKIRIIGEKNAKDPEQIIKAAGCFLNAPLIVTVIESPKPSAKIPQIEQTYSAGAVCLALLNTALAMGWGANWISGWPAHDRAFVEEHLGLQSRERIAGFIHIGTASVPAAERPRPNMSELVAWRD